MFAISRSRTRIILVLSLAILLFAACKKGGEEPDNTIPTRPVTAQSSAYVTQLFDYSPAPGQFINTSSGNMDAAKGVLNGKTGLVSLGAYGGNIVLGFDHTVMNEPNKEDIIIYNNASTGYAEPGVVWVMRDSNGNGLPDDVWYELAGSATDKAGYKRDWVVYYSRPDVPTNDVPWMDGFGVKGVVKTNTYHKQPYYPEWITKNTLILEGPLLPTTNINSTNPTFITSNAFEYGYADNTPGGDKLDIANAVDNRGNKVSLRGIDFIKVQTGIAYDLGWLGELSTEIKGIADISLEKL
ncbi:cell surface protein [Mucilaginibacter daejeonensis]|uniref:cell surface protein n=1 Tax=Mucilaginibacter daejeonensis TaxID=398049 RepID=UPI001D171FBA|nr:cell surface protein [Mucilaginibacter daejeonensis]UEG55169.1 cell surface protein [Mucilaginibacter daejeonensis]